MNATTTTELQRSIRCGCGQPVRGPVAGTADTPAHYCRQCSEGHCALTAFLKATS